MIGPRQFQMRIGHEHCCNRWVCCECRRSSVGRTQRKGRVGKAFVKAVWKKARDASERSLSEIVKDSEARAQCGIPISNSFELICNADSRCKISVGCFIKPRTTRRECDRRWISQADHREGIVIAILSL